MLTFQLMFHLPLPTCRTLQSMYLLFLLFYSQLLCKYPQEKDLSFLPHTQASFQLFLPVLSLLVYFLFERGLPFSMTSLFVFCLCQSSESCRLSFSLPLQNPLSS